MNPSQENHQPGTHQPIPFTADRDTGPFWEGCAQQRLLVALREDGSVVHPPVATGTARGPRRWVEAKGTATLHTWTVVRHAVDPAFPAPYTLVLVELTDHPVRLIGTLDAEVALEAGMPMRVRWEDRGGVTIPQWEPDPGPSTPDSSDPDRKNEGTRS
ncbi:OB-fold domain-containing protein [Gordonia sp. GONU]|uniref:Zn-ribbon domain-containing OB-fold protein n=1 Tax=Gordonia TaxID=2053 RepID=UPI0004229382|nr:MULTISPECIES: OB-fold domain-containing protein [Gordonia]MCR8899860.1 OB-fold domain-containing protein [Gordonia sp. GONU]MCZ4650576.1 OB-fold domain-containing protein [Gordonia amicalis]